MDYAECDVLADPDDFSEDVKPAFQRWAREVLARRIPAYASQPDAGSLAGWYTLSPDSQPLLGPLPGLEGVFIAAGFSGHGFKLAPRSAKASRAPSLGPASPPPTIRSSSRPTGFARGWQALADPGGLRDVGRIAPFCRART
jgi:glycine/D-amino acid oxidase-like deaminating enzyme